jgi:hypothetical protein
VESGQISKFFTISSFWELTIEEQLSPRAKKSQGH